MNVRLSTKCNAFLNRHLQDDFVPCCDGEPVVEALCPFPVLFVWETTPRPEVKDDLRENLLRGNFKTFFTAGKRFYDPATFTAVIAVETCELGAVYNADTAGSFQTIKAIGSLNLVALLIVLFALVETGTLWTSTLMMHLERGFSHSTANRRSSTLSDGLR